VQSRTFFMKRALVVISLITLGAFLLLPVKTSAQGYEYCHSWSFSSSQDGWTISSSGSHDGSGFTNSGPGSDGVYITSPETYFESNFQQVTVAFNDSFSGTNPRILIYDYDQQTEWGSSSATGDTIAVSLSNAQGHFVQVVADRYYQGTQYFEGLHLIGVEICGSGADPWIPPNTPTPTPSPTPGVSSDALLAACIVMPQEQAKFNANSGWSPAQNTAQVGYLPGGGATLSPGATLASLIGLNQQQKYKAVMLYTASAGRKVSIGVGGINLPVIAAGSGLERYESEGFNPPLSEGGKYPVLISTPPENSGTVNLSYFCLIPVTSGNLAPVAEYNPDSCFSCEDYIFIDRIICQIRQSIECFLAFILRRMFAFISGLMVLGVGAVKLAIDSAEGGAQFGANVVGEVGGFLGSGFSNLTSQVGNGLNNSVGAGINTMMSNVRDLPTAMLNIVGTFAQGSLLSINGDNLLSTILSLIGVTFNAVGDFLALIPTVLAALIDGFNSPGESISQSIVCTNPNILAYYPCLGFYILDNTIFSGPAFLLIPVLMGIMAFNTFIWIAGKVGDALDG